MSKGRERNHMKPNMKIFDSMKESCDFSVKTLKKELPETNWIYIKAHSGMKPT